VSTNKKLEMQFRVGWSNSAVGATSTLRREARVVVKDDAARESSPADINGSSMSMTVPNVSNAADRTASRVATAEPAEVVTLTSDPGVASLPEEADIVLWGALCVCSHADVGRSSNMISAGSTYVKRFAFVRQERERSPATTTRAKPA